jgi:hypothetical protein
LERLPRTETISLIYVIWYEETVSEIRYKIQVTSGKGGKGKRKHSPFPLDLPPQAPNEYRESSYTAVPYTRPKAEKRKRGHSYFSGRTNLGVEKGHPKGNILLFRSISLRRPSIALNIVDELNTVNRRIRHCRIPVQKQKSEKGDILIFRDARTWGSKRGIQKETISLLRPAMTNTVDEVNTVDE